VCVFMSLCGCGTARRARMVDEDAPCNENPVRNQKREKKRRRKEKNSTTRRVSMAVTKML
jgi:hypothetical protein